MEKTITIDNKPIRFRMNAAFTYVYKNQFGKDVLTIIMPLISEVLANADEIFKKNAQDIVPSDIAAVLEGVYSLEMIDIQNMIWTMARLADDSIPEPQLWYGQFEEIAILDVAAELAPMFISSLVSKKKLKDLRAMAAKK